MNISSTVGRCEPGGRVCGDFDCSTRWRSLRADRACELAYFVVARRRKACLLTPPQHGEGRDPILIAPLAGARSARIAPVNSPTSSSLADEKRVCSLLLSTARGAIRFQVVDGDCWDGIRWFEAEDLAEEIDLRLD
jgi:hypothetical protein